jgi:UDP-N-acetylmuramoyl-L-alanine---L-glutamate ligase
MLSPTLKKLAEVQIIIFGLGAEGLSSYQFLRSKLPHNDFLLIDERPLAEINDIWTELVKKNPQTRFATSLMELSDENLKNSVLFKTPGVPISHPIVRKILEADSQVSSNIQLFFELIKDYQESSRKNKIKLITIGVTGTKGKSTTSSLVHHVLTKNGFESYLGGNIGQPALNLWQEWQQAKHQDQSIFILEMSSHQLAELKSSPNIAVVQDIVSEHLDYYKDFQQYLQAKTQVACYQNDDDVVIFNADSKTASKLASLGSGKEIGFSLKDKKMVALAKKASLLGQHNLYNVMPAIIIGKRFKLTESKIGKAIKNFKPLAHRLQLIATINGVKYYDDSISTVPESAIAAIRAFPNKSIILLAGGYERQQDFRDLAKEIINCRVKALSLLPPTGQRLLRELEKHNPCNELRASIEEFSSMHEAVYYAYNKAKSGDIVLLSPGAASYGAFKSFIDRGNQFKEAVKRLEE